MSSIQSVERAFLILEAVAAHPGGVGVSEIARQVGLPKSTVARLLATLAGLAAVERLPNSDRVRLGRTMLSLALQVPYPRQLSALARPFLLDLAEATGEAVSVCLPDGEQVFYADQVQSRHRVQVRDWTGERVPMHGVSAGKVFLASWEKGALARYWERPLIRYTLQTAAEPQELGQQLEQIRQQGYCWAVGEFEEGLTGLAAPVRDGSGRVVAALNIFGPSFRFPREGQQEHVAQLLVEACGRMGARL